MKMLGQKVEAGLHEVSNQVTSSEENKFLFYN